MTAREPPAGGVVLLAVELHDELLLDRGVDHLAGRERVDEDPHPVGLLVVAAELLLEHAVDAGALLLLPLLQEVLAVLRAAAAVLTRRIGPDLDRALRRLALAALEEQLHLLAAATLAVRAGVTRHLDQTLRRFGGRQPLWGTGVTSEIVPTSR